MRLQDRAVQPGPLPKVERLLSLSSGPHAVVAYPALGDANVSNVTVGRGRPVFRRLLWRRRGLPLPRLSPLRAPCLPRSTPFSTPLRARRAPFLTPLRAGLGGLRCCRAGLGLSLRYH